MPALIAKLREIVLLPKVRVNLALSAAGDNDPFFGRVVAEFHRQSTARHPKLPLAGAFTWGVALCKLPPTFAEYFGQIDAAARRNFKKAEREGYSFARINFNDHLADIGDIRRSAPVRQGPMPEEYLKAEVAPCSDPPSRTNLHDYPYFGILRQGRLVAYAGCLVAGEIMLIQHILGHADHLAAGVVPLLVIHMAGYCLEHYPQARYLAYGGYFGGRPEMRRFKAKLGLTPHRVRWVLDAPLPPLDAPPPPPPVAVGLSVPAHLNYQLIFRQELARPMAQAARRELEFAFLDCPLKALLLLGPLARDLGPAGLIKALLKLCTPSRTLYVIVEQGRVTTSGWITAGHCRHYLIEKNAAIVGPINTPADQRRRGLASYALRAAMNECHFRGWPIIYIDTDKHNVAAQKTFAKCGFGEPMGLYPR